jgi:periplasmic divalent cation tolerance protein
MDCLIVLTTMPADGDAAALADALVNERLAACVSVMAPMESTYRWEGVITRERERQMIIKTTPARLLELQARLRALHPYEVPEFLVLPSSASDAYGRWVADQTTVQ